MPSPLRAASAEEATDLQHALFKEDSRRVILFDGDCGFCSEGTEGRGVDWKLVGSGAACALCPPPLLPG